MNVNTKYAPKIALYKRQATLFLSSRFQQAIGRYAMSNKKSSSNRQVQTISISEIIPDPHQTRKEFTDFDIDSLAKSIEQNGQLYPILVEQTKDNEYQIIDGERRWRAFKKLSANSEGKDDSKYAAIEAIIMESKSELKGLLANIVRKEYNPMEFADALLALKNTLGKNTKNEDIGKYIGKSRTNVNEYFSLHNLPVDIQEKAKKESFVPFNRLKCLAQSKASDDEKLERYNNLHDHYKNKFNDEKHEKKGEETSVSNRATKHYFSIGKKLEKLNDELVSLAEQTYEDQKQPTEKSKEDLLKALQEIMASANKAIAKLQGK